MAPLDRLIQCYETLTPERVSALVACYAPDAYFKDPFNEVRGPQAIARIFTHMFTQVEAPHFRVIDRLSDENSAMLSWVFSFGPAGKQQIRGMTHLQFNAQGLVVLHRDYWDAAEEVYAKIPVLGGLIRLLGRMLKA